VLEACDSAGEFIFAGGLVSEPDSKFCDNFEAFSAMQFIAVVLASVAMVVLMVTPFRPKAGKCCSIKVGRGGLENVYIHPRFKDGHLLCRLPSSKRTTLFPEMYLLNFSARTPIQMQHVRPQSGDSCLRIVSYHSHKDGFSMVGFPVTTTMPAPKVAFFRQLSATMFGNFPARSGEDRPSSCFKEVEL